VGIRTWMVMGGGGRNNGPMEGRLGVGTWLEKGWVGAG